MNGIHLPNTYYHSDKKNIFEIRNDIYDELVKKSKDYIDRMFDVCDEDKKKDIMNRKCTHMPYKNSKFEFHKGIEFPIIDKVEMVLDGISYIPTMQIVDNSISSQKNGKYIVIKTNLRYSILKMNGTVSFINNKIGFCPLLMYLLYEHDNDVIKTLQYFNFEITDNEEEAEYKIPNYLKFIENINSDIEWIYVKKCKEGYWKDYLLSTYREEYKNIHIKMLEFLKEEYEKYYENDEEENQDSMIVTGDTDPSMDEYVQKNDEVYKMEVKNNENLNDEEKKRIILLSFLIQQYYISTKRNKRYMKRNFIISQIRKLCLEDITLRNVSIMKILNESILNDHPLPDVIDIGDLNQKNIRYIEWLSLKMISVRSYPEKSMIMEVCKIEPKLVYNNTTNPLSELSVMSRANMFGKGGLPREACQANVRNLHDSYFGIIDPCDTPSGANVGISLHVVPELQTFEFRDAIKEKDENNIFA